MPRFKIVTKLETLALKQFCKICAITCTSLEEKADDEDKEEVVFKSFLIRLPRTILEQVISETLKIITSKVRKNRNHKGLIKAVQCLPQKSVQKLDFASLYSEVRLYGSVNAKLKETIEDRFNVLCNLIELNLSSKCSDRMLVQISKHCQKLEIIHMALSDITDRGLMALAGLSMNGEVGQSDGCKNLCKINVQNCAYITPRGAACLLSNLKNLKYLYYDKLLDALEIIIKVHGNSQSLKIIHIDQFGDFYDFESNPDLISAIAQVCPHLESFRFFMTDKGCRFLKTFKHMKHLQLEMTENVGQEFINLTENFSNLVSLQLTFRDISKEALEALQIHCMNIEVIKLIGYKILSSERLTSSPQSFKRLKVLEIRIVRSDERFEDFIDHHESEDDDSITPQLLAFFLSNCVQIQDITISAMLEFLNEDELMKLFDKNPMSELQRLCICPLNKANNLNVNVASNIIMSLPNLQTMALSRWKIRSKEFDHLRKTLRCQNIDIALT